MQENGFTSALLTFLYSIRKLFETEALCYIS